MADEQRHDQASLELPSPFKGRKDTRAGDPPSAEPVETRRHQLPPVLAATVTGALTGMVTVGLVWSAMRGCSILRGTTSCGDSGYVVLMAVFVVMVLGGRAMLAALGVPEAGSTALLGMALVAVVALMWVVDLESPPGAALLAVAGALAFALSQWVTSTFSEPGHLPR